MATSSVTLTPRDKFVKLRQHMRGELFERDDVIEAMMLALISKSHLFMLGPPGVAKSLAVRKFVSHIDDLTPEEYFEILMMRSTVREEVFGPLDLLKLKQGIYSNITRGALPEAKIAFLDEIWKANSAILNALLMASNERLFRNEGAVHPIPLWSMIVASNEMPEGDELAAMYDRVNMRLLVEPIREPKNFIGVLKLDTDDPNPEKIISWSDIVTANAESKMVKLGDDIFDAIYDVKQDLAAENIYPTDRRFAQAMKIVRAAAWFDGETEADIEHVRPLRHVLWDTVDQQKFVEGKMVALANPFDKEAMALLDEVRKMSTELDKTLRDSQIDHDLKVRKGVELHASVKSARADLSKLSTKMKESGSKRKSAKFDECKEALLDVTRRLLEGLFDVSGNALDDASLGGDDD